MNKVMLIGNLAKDVELTQTSAGIKVARFTVATQRQHANNGEKVADFHNCVAWRGLAENLARFCKKGSKVYVEGELQTRNYTAKDGSKRYVVEVMADKIEFLNAPKSSEKTAQSEAKLVEIQEIELPF